MSRRVVRRVLPACVVALALLACAPLLWGADIAHAAPAAAAVSHAAAAAAGGATLGGASFFGKLFGGFRFIVVIVISIPTTIFSPWPPHLF